MGGQKVQLTGSEASSKMYNLCNKNQYFTCGSCRQYDKFFDMVKDGVHLEIIARVLWVCSSDNYSYEGIYKDCYETLMVEAGGRSCE